MFWRKEEKKVEQKVVPEVKQVKCAVCKHYVDKNDAQAVEKKQGSDVWGYFMVYSTTYPNDALDYGTHYYCPLHRKPYDSIVGSDYFRSVKVTEQGEPVGYVKIKPKKK